MNFEFDLKFNPKLIVIQFQIDAKHY